jgi:hypothetical protein
MFGCSVLVPALIGGLSVETDVSEAEPHVRGRAFNFLVPPRGGSEVWYTESQRHFSFHFSRKDRHIFYYTIKPHTPYTQISLKKVIMAAIDLKALRFPFKDPKFIFFTDFDGTITLKDSNDFMVSLCSYQNLVIAQMKSAN